MWERLQKDPTWYPKALNSLGWYHFQGESEEANQYFLKILAEFPQYRPTPSIFLMVGQCYLNQNDYQKAKELFNAIGLHGGGEQGSRQGLLSPWMGGLSGGNGLMRRFANSNALGIEPSERLWR